VGGRSCCCWICRARGCIERSLSHDHVTVWRFFLSPSRHFFRRLEFSFFTWCLGGIFFLTTTTTHGMMLLFQYLKWRAPEAILHANVIRWWWWLAGSIHVHVLEIARPCVFFCLVVIFPLFFDSLL
jgi:hypothetical protein